MIVVVLLALTMGLVVGIATDLLQRYAADWERRQYDAESHRRLLRELDRQP